MISKFKQNGLDKNKLFLTLKNLKKSNRALKFYVEQNKINSFLNNENKEVVNEDFFSHPYEIILDLSDSLKMIGDKYYSTRGKKIDFILNKIKKNTAKRDTSRLCDKRLIRL